MDTGEGRKCNPRSWVLQVVLPGKGLGWGAFLRPEIGIIISPDHKSLGPASLFNGCRDRESLVTCSDLRVRVFSCCFQGAVSLQENKQPANLMATDPLIDRPSLGFLQEAGKT